MATHEELFTAVRLIKNHCKEHHGGFYCLQDCPFHDTCEDYFYVSPKLWDVPDKEGSGDVNMEQEV